MKTHTAITGPSTSDTMYATTWRITVYPVGIDGSLDSVNSYTDKYDYTCFEQVVKLQEHLALVADRVQMKSELERRFLQAVRTGDVLDAMVYAYALGKLGEDEDD